MLTSKQQTWIDIPLILFKKKIRDTKGTLHAMVGSIKDRNGMNLNTQKNYANKIFMTQVTMMV